MSESEIDSSAEQNVCDSSNEHDLNDNDKRKRTLSEDDDSKLQRCRERNRFHARNTRERKKNQIEMMLSRIEKLNEERAALSAQVVDTTVADILMTLSSQEKNPNLMQQENSNNPTELKSLDHICTNVLKDIANEGTNSIKANLELLNKDKSSCTSAELDSIRRERNRLHAKKTRLRKKIMLQEMEANLLKLEEEVMNLRKKKGMMDPNGFMLNGGMHGHHPGIPMNGHTMMLNQMVAMQQHPHPQYHAIPYNPESKNNSTNYYYNNNNSEQFQNPNGQGTNSMTSTSVKSPANSQINQMQPSYVTYVPYGMMYNYPNGPTSSSTSSEISYSSHTPMAITQAPNHGMGGHPVTYVRVPFPSHPSEANQEFQSNKMTGQSSSSSSPPIQLQNAIQKNSGQNEPYLNNGQSSPHAVPMSMPMHAMSHGPPHHQHHHPHQQPHHPAQLTQQYMWQPYPMSYNGPGGHYMSQEAMAASPHMAGGDWPLPGYSPHYLVPAVVPPTSVQTSIGDSKTPTNEAASHKQLESTGLVPVIATNHHSQPHENATAVTSSEKSTASSPSSSKHLSTQTTSSSSETDGMGHVASASTRVTDDSGSLSGKSSETGAGSVNSIYSCEGNAVANNPLTSSKILNGKNSDNLKIVTGRERKVYSHHTESVEKDHFVDHSNSVRPSDVRI